MFTVRIALVSALCTGQSAETEVKPVQDSFKKIAFFTEVKIFLISSPSTVELFAFKS